jgi:hypothetical protein
VTGNPESMLALDVGSAYVKATLVDRVGDTHRFVARGVAPQVASIAPGSALRAPLLAALGDLEDMSGRRVADREGMPIVPEQLGVGVDAVGGVVSVLGQLAVAICSLRAGESLRHAEAALAAVPSTVVARITGREIASREEAFERFAQTIRDRPPHVLMLLGGDERKPDRAVVSMAEALAVAASLLRPAERPTLLYAGPQSLRQAVTAAAAEVLPVRMVDSPSADGKSVNLGPLRRELDVLYLSLLGDSSRDMELVWRWCGGRVTSVGQAMLRAYTQRGVDVLAADVGASSTVLVRTGQGQVLVSQNCGVGRGAHTLLERAGTQAFLRWIAPEEVDEAKVVDWAMNRQVRPWLRAATDAEAQAELACAREALSAARTQAAEAWPEGRDYPAPLPPKVDMVVGGGAVLGRSHSLARAAAALLDGLQPVGVCRLALDWDNLVTSLGALAELNPDAVLSVLEQDGVLVLGTLIAPVGQARYGREALRVQVSGPGDQASDVKVAAGEIVRIPLGPGARARATIHPARGLDVGAGKGQGLEVEVEGGPLGVVIDTRGRPLPEIANLSDRRGLLRRWLQALEV